MDEGQIIMNQRNLSQDDIQIIINSDDTLSSDKKKEIMNENQKYQNKDLFSHYQLGFNDTKTFIDRNCRIQLPFLLPANYSVPIWKIVGKFMTQDLTRISLPIILNEPLNTLQKMCEMQINHLILEKAANQMPESGEDSVHYSCKRLLSCALYSIIQFSHQTERKKKIFNPILGETYEFVNSKYRFLGEQVSHHPPISAFQFEGKNYQCEGNNQMVQSFAIGGGSGQLIYKQIGLNFFKLIKYGDEIQITKPSVEINNLIFGNLYIDLEGVIKGKNKKTGDFCEIKCTPRSWTESSQISGFCADKDGNIIYQITGRWQDKIEIISLKDGKSEIFWEKNNQMIDNYERQYNFNKLSVKLNYLPKDIEECNKKLQKCFLPPTDSRFRQDMRLLEQGKFQEADEEKVRLEIKQRVARQQAKESGVDFEPNFFIQEEYENEWTQNKEIRYRMKTGENNYWMRRESCSWEGLPDLY